MLLDSHVRDWNVAEQNKAQERCHPSIREVHKVVCMNIMTHARTNINQTHKHQKQRKEIQIPPKTPRRKGKDSTTTQRQLELRLGPNLAWHTSQTRMLNKRKRSLYFQSHLLPLHAGASACAVNMPFQSWSTSLVDKRQSCVVARVSRNVVAKARGRRICFRMSLRQQHHSVYGLRFRKDAVLLSVLSVRD